MPIDFNITADSLSQFLKSKGGKPAAAPASAAPPDQSSAGDVKSIVSSAARKHGVPEDLALRMTGAESTYNPSAQNQRSSAGGLYQMIDSTWKSMGGTPGNKYDPRENADVGSRYVRTNIDALHNRLGRDITYGETYAAHMFGSGVANMLSRAPMNAPIEQGLSTFESRSRVQQILSQNPNLRGKTVGQVMQELESKVGRGVIRRPSQISDAADTIPQDMQLASADEYQQAWDDQDQENIA